LASNRLEILVSGDARQLNQTLKEVEKSVDDTVGQLVSKSQQAALALGAISAAGGALLAGFVSKASEMQSFEAQLTGLTGNAGLARQKLQEMADFAAKTPFDLPGVVQAGTVLTGLGQDVSAQLPRVGNLASVMRRDLSEAALIWGKSLKGSRDGLQSLFDAGVTTKDELHKFGAELESNGAIAVEGEAAVEKLRDALTKMADTKFGGVMAEQSKTLEASLSSLGDAFGQAQAALGQNLTPTVKSGSEALTGLLNCVKDMDPGMRGLITTGILAGTVITGMAAAGAAMTAVYLPASMMWAAYTASAAAAAATSLTNAVANHAATMSLVEQTAAEVVAAEALVAEAQAAVLNAGTKAEGIIASEGLAIAETELAAATEAATAANLQYAGSSEAVIVAQGQQTAASTGLLGKIGAMATTGLGPLIILLGAVALALAGYTAYLESCTAEQEKALEVSQRQVLQLHKEKSITLEAAEAVKKWGDDTEKAADQVAAALHKLGKDDLDITHAMAGNGEILKNLREQQRRLNLTSGNDEQKAIVAAQIAEYEKRNEVLAKARVEFRGMHDAEMKAAADKSAATKKEQGEAEALLKRYKEKSSRGVFANNSEELAALDQVTARIGKQHKEYAELIDKRIKLARDVSKEEGDAQLKVRDQQAKGADDAVNAVREQFKQGKATVAQVEEQIHLRDQLVAKIRMEKAEQDSLGKSAAARAQILKAAETENATEAKKSARDVEQIRRDAAKETEDARLKARDEEAKGADEAISAVREQFKQGKATVAQVQEQIQLRDQLVAKIRLEKAEQESLGKSAATRAQIIKAAESQNATEAKKSARDVEQLKQDALKETAKVREKLAASELTAAQSALEVTKDKFASGEDVLEQLKQEIKARDDLAAAVTTEKAAQEGIGKGAQARAALNKAADAENAAARSKSAMESKKLEEQAAKRRADEDALKKDETVRGQQLEENSLRKRAEAGEKVESRLKQLMDQRQQSERDALVAKASANEIGASGNEKARIRRDLELDMSELTQKQVEEQRALTEELKKQKELADAKKSDFSLGGMSGVEGAGDFSAFDLTAKNTLKDVKDDQAKAKRDATNALGKDGKPKKDKKDSGSYPGQEQADAGADKKPAGKDADKPGGAPPDAELNAKALQDIAAQSALQTQLLQQIVAAQKEPVKVQVSNAGGGPSTAQPDWRTSTNKTENS
jgi:hypothetical protein